EFSKDPLGSARHALPFATDRRPEEMARPAAPDHLAAPYPSARQARSCCKRPLPPSASALSSLRRWPVHSASIPSHDRAESPEFLSPPLPLPALIDKFPSVASAWLALRPPLPDFFPRRSVRQLHFSESRAAP